MSRRVRVPRNVTLGFCLMIVSAVVYAVHLATFVPVDKVPSRVPDRAEDAAPREEPASVDDGGLEIAREFTPPIRDHVSLDGLVEAVRMRGPLGLAVLNAAVRTTRLRFKAPREDVEAAADVYLRFGLLNLYEGQYDEARGAFRKALALGGSGGKLTPRTRARLTALAGITALRQGEAGGGEPCTREAVETFSGYLKTWPDDLLARWLLNVACMRLGEYPRRVPEKLLVPVAAAGAGFAAVSGIDRFQDVAAVAGLYSRGPSLAGGTVFDDLNGDGRPDLLLTSLEAQRGPALWLNQGGGTFADRSTAAGLEDQVHAAGAARGDFDNDGDLDLVLLRGAGDRPMRMTLLRNDGKGEFEDVTIASGLGEPIASGAAAWGDYDNDGRLDLFVCGEFRLERLEMLEGRGDRRNLCRLYHNQGDGTFRDAATVAAVTHGHRATGAAWGDYDNDGWPDLLVVNADAPPGLYHNQGDGTFRDEAPSLGLREPPEARSCGFWDLDNDGRLDILISDGRYRPDEFVAAALGLPVADHPGIRLHRGLGASGFQDVTHQSGLGAPLPVLAFGVGDLDGDGFLDLALTSGWPGLASLAPARLFQSVAGERFEDVTLASGTGDPHGGYGVALADHDGDGDLDLLVHGGGLVPADRRHHRLYRNPSHASRHALGVRLVGTHGNRSGVGARIQVDVTAPDGTRMSCFRTVGNDSGSGGGSLAQCIGIGAASRVAQLTVTWPASRSSQTFRDVEADRDIVITEGAESYKVERTHSPRDPRR